VPLHFLGDVILSGARSSRSDDHAESKSLPRAKPRGPLQSHRLLASPQGIPPALPEQWMTLLMSRRYIAGRRGRRRE